MAVGGGCTATAQGWIPHLMRKRHGSVITAEHRPLILLCISAIHLILIFTVMDLPATHVSPHLSMVSLTVSDIGCELEYFYFSSLWPESTQIGPINSLIVYAHERALFRKSC